MKQYERVSFMKTYVAYFDCLPTASLMILLMSGVGSTNITQNTFLSELDPIELQMADASSWTVLNFYDRASVGG